VLVSGSFGSIEAKVNVRVVFAPLNEAFPEELTVTIQVPALAPAPVNALTSPSAETSQTFASPLTEYVRLALRESLEKSGSLVVTVRSMTVAALYTPVVETELAVIA
jgi:hypothetical protein